MTPHALDTGPLVAFLNRHDTYHAWAVDLMSNLKPPLLTCEAVLSEAAFILTRARADAQAVLEMVSRGALQVGFHLTPEIPAVSKLMHKYASVPMSLADACLVRMSELDVRLKIITLDRDFKIYRRLGRQMVPVVMG